MVVTYNLSFLPALFYCHVFVNIAQHVQHTVLTSLIPNHKSQSKLHNHWFCFSCLLFALFNRKGKNQNRHFCWRKNHVYLNKYYQSSTAKFNIDNKHLMIQLDGNSNKKWTVIENRKLNVSEIIFYNFNLFHIFGIILSLHRSSPEHFLNLRWILLIWSCRKT